MCHSRFSADTTSESSIFSDKCIEGCFRAVTRQVGEEHCLNIQATSTEAGGNKCGNHTWASSNRFKTKLLEIVGKSGIRKGRTRATTVLDTRFTIFILLIAFSTLLLAVTSVTTGCWQVQLWRALDTRFVFRASSRSPVGTLTSLTYTGMLTSIVCFSSNIFSCVPYILTSLHVTISTGILAVDDNQSAT